jgi:hypothetical protein
MALYTLQKKKRERCKGACFKASAACFKDNICSHVFYVSRLLSGCKTIFLNMAQSAQIYLRPSDAPPKRPSRFDLVVSCSVGTLAACHQTGGLEQRNKHFKVLCLLLVMLYNLITLLLQASGWMAKHCRQNLS